jgi:hypothetical protein
MLHNIKTLLVKVGDLLLKYHTKDYMACIYVRIKTYYGNHTVVLRSRVISYETCLQAGSCYLAPTRENQLWYGRLINHSVIRVDCKRLVMQ